MPQKNIKSIWKRILLASLIFISYFVIEAISATFYPGAPKAWPEFYKSFIFHLEHGPC